MEIAGEVFIRSTEVIILEKSKTTYRIIGDKRRFVSLGNVYNP
jgi:hypothetical protein